MNNVVYDKIFKILISALSTDKNQIYPSYIELLFAENMYVFDVLFLILYYLLCCNYIYIYICIFILFTTIFLYSIYYIYM